MFLKQPLITAFMVASVLLHVGMSLADDSPAPVCQDVSDSFLYKEMEQLMFIVTQLEATMKWDHSNYDELRENIAIQVKLLGKMEVIVDARYKRALCRVRSLEREERHSN